MAQPEVHALYVALADRGDSGRRAAGYISGVAAPLGRRGVAVDVYRIRPKDLRDPRVLAALRRRGIDRLPAALAGGRPLVGLADIRAYYEALLARRGGGPLDAPRGDAPRGGYGDAPRGGFRDAPRGGYGGDPLEEGAEGSPEEDLDEYFHREMHGGGGPELGDD